MDTDTLPPFPPGKISIKDEEAWCAKTMAMFPDEPAIQLTCLLRRAELNTGIRLSNSRRPYLNEFDERFPPEGEEPCQEKNSFVTSASAPKLSGPVFLS